MPKKQQPRKTRLIEAVYEAQRFIRAAEVAIENSDGKTYGAATRASMDLTRALAEYRKPETWGL